jgi:hypothetical protein
MGKKLLVWRIVNCPEMPTNMCVHLDWKADDKMNS